MREEPERQVLEANKSGSVRSVNRAVAIMKFLAATGASTLTEISDGVDIYKSTAHRLLATLRDEGLVEQDEATSKYDLGYGLVLLASSVTSDLDVLRCARPICERLSEQTGETVTVSVLEDDEAVVIHQAVSKSSAISVDWTGRYSKIHATGAGKVFLAHMPEERLESILRGALKRSTEHTLVDPALLREDLAGIRERDYATCFEELEIGLNVVSAPVRLSDGPVVTAISVSGPAFRFPAGDVEETGALIRRTAAEISRCLGFRGGGG